MANASSREPPHIAACGLSEAQNAGRSGLPNKRHRSWSSSCTHGMPAGLPNGIAGIGLVIDGAMQHAPQRSRHCIGWPGARFSRR